MPTTGTVEGKVIATNLPFVLLPPPPLAFCAPPAPAGDTLHGSSDVAGEAAQFNQSVSAMPCHALGPINTAGQGKADTLSKRSAA